MKNNVSNSEIDTLEKVLNDFKLEWDESQTRRAAKWRLAFFVSFVVALALSLYSSSFWFSNSSC